MDVFTASFDGPEPEFSSTMSVNGRYTLAQVDVYFCVSCATVKQAEREGVMSNVMGDAHFLKQ